MGMRDRLRAFIETAPPEQRMKFYQCRYSGSRLGQLARLSAACAGHINLISGMRGNPAGAGMESTAGGGTESTAGAGMESSVGVRRELFADYSRKTVFTPDSVIGELLKYDVVSFDVFDTLLKRTARHPTDVFYRMEKQLGIQGFAQRRIEAEKKARQQKYAQCGTSEISIEDIYRLMHEGSGNGAPSAAQTLEMKPAAELEMELKMEAHCCRADPVLLRIAGQLHEAGKEIIAVSDMYLHEAQIAALLQGCGYSGIKKIYVSCDYGAGKSDGKLFPLVLGETGAGRKLVHAGDNFYSDVYRQKGLDMAALHYLA